MKDPDVERDKEKRCEEELENQPEREAFEVSPDGFGMKA
jgi:hypothetical protein